MVIPSLNRVLAFYSPAQSGTMVEDARTQLGRLGVELVAVAVDTTAEIEQQYAEHRGKVDGVWMINDPMVMNRKTFAFLRDRTRADKLPFAASLSEELAKAGALMAVSPDFKAIGSQVAGMARMFLEQGMAAADIGIQPPISSRLVVNLETARSIGLAIPEEVMPYIVVAKGPQIPAGAGRQDRHRLRETAHNQVGCGLGSSRAAGPWRRCGDRSDAARPGAWRHRVHRPPGSGR